MVSEAVVIDVGGLPVRLATRDSGLVDLLRRRYAGFLSDTAAPQLNFDITVIEPGTLPGDADLTVTSTRGVWRIARGDFRAEWDMASRRGTIAQTLNPYSADTVLRIVYTLLLSQEGGFLQHAASAVRNGRAVLFTGRSGAGKTTISRLAPPDVTLLTDEISFVRRVDGEYRAFGTPFAGELGTPGEPVSAPLAAIYHLERGDNVVERLPRREAVRTVMHHVLFFADEARLTAGVLDAVCDCTAVVPVSRLAFRPEAQVWNLVA